MKGCYTFLSDKEMLEKDPVTAKEIIKAREKIIKKLEGEEKPVTDE